MIVTIPYFEGRGP